MDEYYDAIRLLPAFLRLTLAKLEPTQARLVQEIRLRSGRPAAITLQGQACFITPEAGTNGAVGYLAFSMRLFRSQRGTGAGAWLFYLAGRAPGRSGRDCPLDR